MNLLRAQVHRTEDWWEMKLLDLDLVADGDSEDAMLRDLEHTLIAEYHIALKFGQTPFVKLFKGCPPEVSKSWEDGGKKLRTLNLPTEVSMALSAVFHAPRLGSFEVEAVAA